MFLGNTENQPSEPIEATKTEEENKIDNAKENEVDKIEDAPVACSLCNIEMSQTKTTFKIDGWEGQKLAGEDSDKNEVLPVIVYVCPQCGKIEFKAEKTVKSS